MTTTFHNYKKRDEIIINYLYRYGINSLIFTKEKISELLGMSIDAIIMKMSNHRTADGTGTFNHYSKLTVEVNNVMKKVAQEKHKKIVMKVLLKLHNKTREN